MLMTGSGLGFISRQSSKGSLHLNHPFSRSSSPFAPTTASGRTPDSARPMFGTQLWSDASGHSSKPESLTTVIHQCHSKGRSQGSHQSSTVSLAQRLIRIDYRTLPRCAPPSFSPYHMRRRVANVSGVDHDISFGDKSLLDAMAPLCSALELNRVWIDEVTGGDSSNLQSSKVFLYEDYSEKCYICILTAGNLRLVRYSKGRDFTTAWSSSSNIRCIDALPVKELRVLLLLREGSHLCLFCGEQEVCKVDIGCTLSVKQLISSANNDAYIESVSGQTMQVILPAVASSTAVSTCLKALRCVLPHNVYNSLHSQWYVHIINKSNQANIGSRKLLEIFSSFVLEACGIMKIDMESSAAVSAKNEAWHKVLDELEKPAAAVGYLVGLPQMDNSVASVSICKQLRIDDSSLLYNHLAVVFFSLHLVHEEMKLNCLFHGSLVVLAQLLVTVAICLTGHSYLEYYYKSYPRLYQMLAHLQVEDESKRRTEEYLSDLCDVMLWLQNSFDCDQDPFPVLNGVTRRTQNVCIAFSMFRKLSGPQHNSNSIVKSVGLRGDDEVQAAISLYEKLIKECSPMNAIVKFIAVQGFSPEILQSLPVGVALPLKEALNQCCSDPPTDWPIEAYHILGRDDLAKQKDVTKGKDVRLEPKATIRPLPRNSKDRVDDGMDHLIEDEILRMRFSQDHRIREVRHLLQSAKPCRITVKQKPEVSDHDFIEEQERMLFLICQRTMALPVARGMFTLGTLRPIATESLTVPSLILKGQAPPRNTAVNLDHIDTPAGMTDWPEFHNGVACGLVIDPRMKEVNSAWITYNQPADKQLTNEHAGFLLALGLTGHLKNLDTHHIHSYLAKGHELTSVGLLLGLAAAKRGTSDIEVTRILSIHVQALLPLGSAELDIPPLVRVAALAGIGLVYEGTTHRHTAEVLLGEIDCPPGPEQENATNRESYSLTAGLALGMVTLGKADSAVGLSDLKIADTLIAYMTSGQPKRPAKVPKKEDTSSQRILETGRVNTHVTAPGAILALGLIYMKSNNDCIAQRLDTPDSQFALQSIRPDFLTLRMISYGLILWNTVMPSEQWVESRIPHNVGRLAFQASESDDIKSDENFVDVKLMSEAKIHITAGACMAIGLKFAGTANRCAFECLLKYCKELFALSTSLSADQVGKFAIEYCLGCCLLALSMVMAGTGNVPVLRLIRQLHARLHGNEINYGSHMGVHMALGFLFLGGGRYSLMESDRAIPSLLFSVFPMFPYHSSDNRYHLQALRHLYVLACEPRLLIPRDVHTLKLSYVPAEIIFRESVTFPVLLPCLLPPLNSIKEVRISCDRYWPIRVLVEGNEEGIRSLLAVAGGNLLVKKRQGYLSYQQDPKNFGLLSGTGSKHVAGLHGLELPSDHGNSMPEYWLPLASMKIGANQTFGSHFHNVESGVQEQAGEGAEVALRFYSSVPNTDYKMVCRVNMFAPWFGNCAVTSREL
ncbi:anaphase-promoting complex subunit 1-like isoform X2 [Corticium candelabrum]|uniref:anaphase-promoting complex subunit 1-like isoform X2 n=1 Tax=Corticium candelabrum TaxID=121492 RepID=UPI002E266B4B|nr:anaphase-promoting complex subunit 1-like isoform X2 [Corticium candelabrum]